MTALFAYLGDGFQPSHLLEPTQPPPLIHLHETERQNVIAHLTQLNNIP